MAKLPRIPSGWDEDPATPEASLRESGQGTAGGLLDGWEQPGWSLENSGLGILLHPETITRTDFSDKGGPAETPVSLAGKLAEERSQLFPWESGSSTNRHLQIAQAGGPLPFYMRAVPVPRPAQLPRIDRERMEIDGTFDTHAEAPGAIRQKVMDAATGVYQGRIVEDFNRDWANHDTPIPIPKDRTYWIGPDGISPIGRTQSYETKYGRTYVHRNGDRKPDLEIEIDPKTGEQLVNYGDGAGFQPYNPKRVVKPPYIEPPHLSRKIPLK